MTTAIVDPNAFSLEKRTQKKGTDSFLRRGCGTGGLSATESKRTYEDAQAAAESDAIIQKPARIPRATEDRCNPANTELRTFYERGDLPTQVDHRGVVNALMWKVDIDQLDYHHYLPIFFDGLREQEHPYNFVGFQGCQDLLNQGKTQKVLPVIPQLIIPIKSALNTRNLVVMARTIKMICRLINCGGENNEDSDLIGKALVPYYRQILPVFNIFKNHRTNIGDKIDYTQQADRCLADLITETLELMETKGGEDAFINIKYLVPTYETVLNRT